MHKCILIMALLFATLANAQTKPRPGAKPGKQPTKQEIAKRDSLRKDSLANAKIEEAPVKLPHEFMVYSKKAKAKDERTKLCFNLIHNDLALNYCTNDSLCLDPEVSKVMFEQKNGDTLYVLIFVEAFTKIDGFDDGRCSAGRETKLVFAKWNIKTNQAKWKQKNVSSCRKGITNMTKEPILDWDKTSPLVVNYNRGLNFYEIKFDPKQYQLGFQNNNNNESESK